MGIGYFLTCLFAVVVVAISINVKRYGIAAGIFLIFVLELVEGILKAVQ